ncbi:hypothetical protein CYY_006527 [Polysphondylium violaceum]|uniref:Ankyrin repeat-containing protein n=1 Tax=Polysphondylium violaceum TaxID=133409 RepID=A0A8J4URG1_9MYCE|nr:hypothetical protein CYY_006527 [Polysphondylium violaceum]
MNKDLYQSVFGNIFLSTKVYDHVHQSHADKYPLRYDDIVDVGWMIKYGHVGLLREKIKNNSHLYVKPKDLFSIVAKKDTQIFIYLFERYKYYALSSYDVLMKWMLQTMVNNDVIKYLFQNGYAREIDDETVSLLDSDLVAWLLEFGHIEPSQQVVNELALNRRAKETRERQEKSALNNALLLDINKPTFKVPLDTEIWLSWQDQGEEMFFKMWDSLSSRIRVTDDLIYFHISRDLTDEEDDDDLEYDANVLNIAQHILEAACKIGSVKVIEFIVKKGYFLEVDSMISEHSHDFFKKLINKTLSRDEYKIIEKLTSVHIKKRDQDQDDYQDEDEDEDDYDYQFEGFIDKFEFLQACCQYGDAEKFNYFYTRFKIYLDLEYDGAQLFRDCLESGNNHMIRVLYSHNLFFHPQDKEVFLSLISQFSLGYLLEDVERTIAKDNSVYPTLLCRAIQCNDLFGVKYIFSKHKFDSLDFKIILQISSCQNLAIIDYINKNKSLCFTGQGLANKDDLFHGISLPRLSKLCTSNLPLAEYLIRENCYDISKLTPKQLPFVQLFFGNDHTITKLYGFRQMVYLFDHNNYSSIDPFINLLVSDSENWLKYFEYIYRNQHKFQSKPSFQSILDHIVANLNEQQNSRNQVQESKNQVDALLHKYGCVLNDGQHEHLVQHNNQSSLES